MTTSRSIALTSAGCRLRARLAGDRVQGVAQERGGGEAATVFRVAEAEIGESLRRQVQALLQACFDGYPDRSYFKLPPHLAIQADTGALMVKAIGQQAWPDGEVDLLGQLF